MPVQTIRVYLGLKWNVTACAYLRYEFWEPFLQVACGVYIGSDVDSERLRVAFVGSYFVVLPSRLRGLYLFLGGGYGGEAFLFVRVRGAIPDAGGGIGRIVFPGLGQSHAPLIGISPSIHYG